MCLAKINQVALICGLRINVDKCFKQGVLTRDCMQIDITRKNYTVPNCNYLAIIPTNDDKRFKQLRSFN